MKVSIKKMIQKRRIEAQKGVSNVQIAIGVLVAVVALLGAVGGYIYVNSAKVNNEIQVLSDIKANTVKFGQSVGTFTADNSAIGTLIGLAFFNNPLLATTATTVTDQWGGAVTVAPGTTNTAGDSLTFTFAGIPSHACAELALRVDAIATTVSVNGTSTKSVGVASNPATVATKCAAAVNSIAYTFSR